MFSKISYNRIKLIRFVASVFLIITYVLDFVAKSYLPKTLLYDLVMIALLFYIVSIFLFIAGQLKSKIVVTDELSKENETKAAQYTYLVLTIAVFAGIVLTRLTDKNITLSSEVLFCMIIAISAFNDGCYLYLEGRGGKGANIDDED
ncbi:hypothetical protein IZU99_04315 [Oscillospiraceae bacterium CM]|nr:hypothetical protein IZU99_04315 [Oscillospiraceae bacterium CM]